MPPNVASNFTDTQLAYVEEAIENRPPRNHPVDIRLSIPLLGRGFYLVFLFGREVHSPAPAPDESARFPAGTLPDRWLIRRVDRAVEGEAWGTIPGRLRMPSSIINRGYHST